MTIMYEYDPANSRPGQPRLVVRDAADRYHSIKTDFQNATDNLARHVRRIHAQGVSLQDLHRMIDIDMDTLTEWINDDE